ncbi:MAG: DUF47 domain-containing protein [Dehalococcoidales bacterium]|nr:DUF47 domain-containing protein [Dehalococcoidales bacterium]
MVKISFTPKQDKFYDLFEDAAHNLVKISQALCDLLSKWEQVGGSVAEITEMEHYGDNVTHQIIAQLNRTFLTPFDREDIALLAHTMDDIADFVQAAADAMLIYKVEKPTERSKELSEIIVKATVELEQAIKMLKHRADLKPMLERCVEINRLENMADQVYRAGMAELFDNSKDFATVIKWREIYEHLESATDRGEDVANVLEGVALKNA